MKGATPVSHPLSPRAPLASEPGRRHFPESLSCGFWNTSVNPLYVSKGLERQVSIGKRLVVHKNPADSWFSFKGKKAPGVNFLSCNHGRAHRAGPDAALPKQASFFYFQGRCFRRQPPTCFQLSDAVDRQVPKGLLIYISRKTYLKSPPLWVISALVFLRPLTGK